MARRLVLFTSLPKVGGHSTLTEGLCRLFRPAFEHIEVWCKPMPDHGHSSAMMQAIEATGIGVKMLADESGKMNVAAVADAVRVARARRKDTVFFTLAMRHLSVALAAALQPARSIYYHITHDLNSGTVRRLKLYSRIFEKLVFICPATYRMFPGAQVGNKFAWAPQASEISVHGIEEILARKAARAGSPTRFGLLGRLTVEKGARAMLDFFDTAGLPCELHVAGAGPFAHEFEARARDAAASSSRVVFHGSYDPSERASFLRRFFSDIDLLLVPSQDEWETLSMVALEALQHGTPSLLCATGGLVSFGMPDLGPAPQSIVGLAKPAELAAELRHRMTSSRPDPVKNGGACLKYYRDFFSDEAVLKRWADLLLI